MKTLLPAVSMALLAVLLCAGCEREGRAPNRTDTTAGQGNYGTTSPVTPRGATVGEAENVESPASTVLPGTTHPGTPASGSAR